VKIVEATHFISDSDSDFVSEIKKKKKATNVEIGQSSKPINKKNNKEGKRTQKSQFQKKAKKWLG